MKQLPRSPHATLTLDGGKLLAQGLLPQRIRHFSDVGGRLALALRQSPTSWTVATLTLNDGNGSASAWTITRSQAAECYRQRPWLMGDNVNTIALQGWATK